MPSKKTLELQDFSMEDLRSELAETEAQYKKMTFDHATKGLDNPLVLREVRRDIARLQTELRKREMGEFTDEQINGRSKIRARRSSKRKK